MGKSGHTNFGRDPLTVELDWKHQIERFVSSACVQLLQTSHGADIRYIWILLATGTRY